MPKGVYKNPVERGRKISLALKGHPIYRSKLRGQRISQALKGRPSIFKGRKHTEEAKLKNRLAHLGKISTSKTKFKKKDKRVCGQNNNNWKGGVNKLNKSLRKLIMATTEYKEWRKKVFKRDKFTCRECRKKGGYLNAHHIKQFAFYPKLRFKVSNGLTLCKKCHYKQEHYR